MDAEHRRGFTLVELLVVIAIIGLLLLLFVPNLDCGRERARMAQCSNNATQLARAIFVRTTSTNRAYPGYLSAHEVNVHTALQDEFPATPEREVAIAWPARLLREIEQPTLWENLLSGQQDFDRPPPLAVLICPSDPPLDIEYAALSYVLNSGMPDITQPSEATPSDLQANGVAHDLRPGMFGPELRASDIRDGSDVTILLAENVQRDYPQAFKEHGNTWLRPLRGAENVEQWYGMTWVYDANDPLHPAAGIFDLFSVDTRSSTNVGEGYGAEGSRFARPASNHMGVFVVAFCGGNVDVLDEATDYRVYQQLMTPDGANAALVDSPETDMSVFMDPPLRDRDY